MCAISVLMQYAGTIPLERWDAVSYDAFRAAVRQVETFDTAIGEPDCVDPEKASVTQRIEARLAAIDKAMRGSKA